MTPVPILPRVGCGAVIQNGDAVLLVKRRREPEAGCWGLPGGKVDPYETVLDAVRREIVEELGVAVKGLRLLCVVDQIDRSNASHWIAPVYLVDTYDGEPAILEDDVLADMGWFSPGNMPAALTEATRQALQAMSQN